MKRYYEIVIIFVPDINEEKLKKDISRVKDIINSNNGEVLTEEHWGNKKLAYQIKKFSNGVYHFISCVVEKTSFVEELKKFLSTNESVLRYGVKKISRVIETTKVEQVKV